MLPRMVEVMLALAILFVPWLAWRMLHLPIASPPRVASTSGGRLPSISQLQGSALFGRASKAKGETRTRAVVSSPIKVDLLGVVRAGDKSAAIVRRAHGQQVVHIGESIAPGVELREVEEKSIIVERAGRLERINLPERHLAVELRGRR